jgi:hypothetical protein
MELAEAAVRLIPKSPKAAYGFSGNTKTQNATKRPFVTRTTNK